MQGTQEYRESKATQVPRLGCSNTQIFWHSSVLAKYRDLGLRTICVLAAWLCSAVAMSSQDAVVLQVALDPQACQVPQVLCNWLLHLNVWSLLTSRVMIAPMTSAFANL